MVNTNEHNGCIISITVKKPKHQVVPSKHKSIAEPFNQPESKNEYLQINENLPKTRSAKVPRFLTDRTVRRAINKTHVLKVKIAVIGPINAHKVGVRTLIQQLEIKETVISTFLKVTNPEFHNCSEQVEKKPRRLEPATNIQSHSNT